jgi:predicted GIY-YIG superfamily endonuclease
MNSNNNAARKCSGCKRMLVKEEFEVIGSRLSVKCKACNKHFCYILTDEHSRRYYRGYTNNPQKRLRQHGRKIRGGARTTSTFASPKFALLITGFSTYRDALRFEYKMKHTRPRAGSLQSAIAIAKRLLSARPDLIIVTRYS